MRDKIGPLEDIAWNIITQECAMTEAYNRRDTLDTKTTQHISGYSS